MTPVVEPGLYVWPVLAIPEDPAPPPPPVEIPVRELVDSSSLETAPPVVVDSDTVILTPASYATWAAMFSAHSTKRRYYLTPGDYTSWGQCAITLSGTTGARKELRYYDPATHDTHPYLRRNPATEARVDVIKFSGGGSRPHDWYFHGLTGRAINGEWSTGSGTSGGKATYVTWDFCLMEESAGYGIRVHSSHVTVQRCVLQQASIAGGAQPDAPGLQIFSNAAEAITDVKFLDNELIDWSDGIALSDDATTGSTPYDNILIEGNDVYVTSARYLESGTKAETENGIDIKAGSNLAEGIILRNNRWWGFRQTVPVPGAVGSLGQAIAIHRYGRNVTIEDDIVGDAPFGITEFSYFSGSGIPQSTPRYTILRRVLFHDVTNISGTDQGACTRTNGDTQYIDCWFSRCDYVHYSNISTYPAGGPPDFTGCTRIDTDTLHPASVASNPYVEANNYVLPTPENWVSYERKRWTGVEVVTGARPAA